MKKYMPLEGLRWSRDSGSALCDTPQNSCSRTGWGELASIDMEERYRLVMSTIFNAIGCRIEVEKMISTGRIDMVVETTNIIYILKLKLSNNGGLNAAEQQIKNNQYVEPFKADKRHVIALAVELDDKGKGLIDWKEV